MSEDQVIFGEPKISKVFQVHPLTVRLLQGTASEGLSPWDKLVRRSCGYNQSRDDDLDDWEQMFSVWIFNQLELHRFPV